MQGGRKGGRERANAGLRSKDKQEIDGGWV
jgi:hypothetical protein